MVTRSLTELSKQRGGVILERPKTKRGYRKIPMAKELVNELREWKLACPPNANGLVFVSEISRPLRRDWANNTIKNTIKRVNQNGNKLRLLAMNNLRHSFASQHLIAGTPLLKVSAMMGHSRPTTTLAIYSRWAEQEKSDAETVLASRIFNADQKDEAKTA
jgi:integrase